MAKKENNLLGLAPLTQNGNGAIIYGVAIDTRHPPSQAEKQIMQETQTQLQTIHSQRVKAAAAAHEIGEIHREAAQEFLEIAIHLDSLKEAAKGKDYQTLVEEYNQRSVQMAAQHLFGVTEVSARNIGMEAARPLYREEAPVVVKMVERPGLMRRLLGG